ncbi:IQ domain-containing protein K isoform X1 [Equus caballus]|uniref:IQ domain-containing protein K isoform X1 n=2 Tax=Equus caballus TaxID=9796 RepID=UPI0038B2DAB7
MAAPRRMGSRLSQREERAGSAESWFTSSASLAPVAPEPPVSPGPVAEPPGKNLWEQICEEYEAEVPPFPEEYKVKPEAVMTQVSPLEETVFRGFRAEQLFPVSQSPTASRIPCPQVKEETVDPKTCSPREFLETFIFPILLPGMTNLLHQAKKEKCFERKKTKFVACDFLTEWLYNHNPKRTEEPFTEFFSIPFVEQWLQLHPRPPIPLSLLLTEEEAALTIQSFWRAYLFIIIVINAAIQIFVQPSLHICLVVYVGGIVEVEFLGQKVRCDPEIQELRQWQKKLRENKHIHQRVRIFWAKQEQKVKCKMEDEEEAAAKAPP